MSPVGEVAPVWDQESPGMWGDPVSIRVARGSAALLSSHGRGIGPQNALKGSPGHAGKEGPRLARTGASQGFPRAAAPVGVFRAGPGPPVGAQKGRPWPTLNGRATSEGTSAPRRPAPRGPPGLPALPRRCGEPVLSSWRVLKPEKGTHSSTARLLGTAQTFREGDETPQRDILIATTGTLRSPPAGRCLRLGSIKKQGAAPRQRPRESFFNASRGPSPLP